MLIDVIGRVQNTTLVPRNGLMPLFEAVINSVDSISESGISNGRIVVRIEREKQMALSQNMAAPNAIEGFTITDNGAGFTKINYDSFETMDSRAKVTSGGKGVGRLLWLKAFDKAEITSIFNESGSWHRRRFEFCPTKKGIENESLEAVLRKNAPAEPSTSVRLLGFKDKFRKATLKAPDGIARRIVEHCLEYYLLDCIPRIVLEDPGTETTVDLGNLYAQEFKGAAGRAEFQIGEQSFELHNVLTRSHSDSQHRLRFCARNRVVESISLQGKIPHLDTPFRDEKGEQVYYQGYVVGALLDEAVNADRSAFDLPRDDEQKTLPSEITWDDVVNAAVQEAKRYLEPHTNEARKRALARVETFVQGEGARYRPLLNHRKAQVENLSTNISNEKLDLELHRLYQDWRQEVRVEVNANLAAVPDDPKDFEAFRESFVKSIGDLQEVVKSDLADYVVYRATVLKYLEKLIGSEAGGAFENEDALHSFVFPQRTTSGIVDYDEHNLWVIDERLVYHQYLASELAFSRQVEAPVAVNGDERPDIIVYHEKIFDEPMAFVLDANAAIGGVSIIEFKKPQRKGYYEEENPIRQVVEYVQAIRGGKVKRKDGTLIEPLPLTVPFFAHIIADLTERFRKEVALAGYFVSTPDNRGYIGYHAAEKCYIEIMSYRKLLDDARKKNAAFFEKLQIRI